MDLFDNSPNDNNYENESESVQSGNQTNNAVSNSVGTSKLPLLAMSEIPTPKADAKRIVGLVKQRGKVSGYKLSDGQIIDKAQGVTLARQGEIKGVGIAKRSGNEYLKSLPDEEDNNNLGNLPTVSQ